MTQEILNIYQIGLRKNFFITQRKGIWQAGFFKDLYFSADFRYKKEWCVKIGGNLYLSETSKDEYSSPEINDFEIIVALRDDFQ